MTSKNYLLTVDPSKIKILYIARFAPLGHEVDFQVPHPEYGMAERYNFELFDILRSLGFEVTPSREMDVLMRPPFDVDYVFSIYNQAPFKGSEIFVSSLCEFWGKPYLGAPPHVRALAEDKHLAKALAKHLGIPTPPWSISDFKGCWPGSPSFPGPYFIKPRFGAQSKYVDEDSIQDLWFDALAAAIRLSRMGIEAIIEQFVEGTNATVPIVAGYPPLVLPVVRSRSMLKGEVVTRAQKKMLQGGMDRNILDDRVRVAELFGYSVKLFESVSPLDYTRIDYRVPYDDGQKCQFIEFNICPNLGSHSTIVFPARVMGISQSELVTKILDFSFRRQKLPGLITS